LVAIGSFPHETFVKSTKIAKLQAVEKKRRKNHSFNRNEKNTVHEHSGTTECGEKFTLHFCYLKGHRGTAITEKSITGIVCVLA